MKKMKRLGADYERGVGARAGFFTEVRAIGSLYGNVKTARIYNLRH